MPITLLGGPGVAYHLLSNASLFVNFVFLYLRNAMQKYYKVLEVPYDAPLADIKQAYRDLVRVWHPDRFARDERLQKRANEKLAELNEAYRVLSSFVPEIAYNATECESSTEPIDWSRVPNAAQPNVSSAPSIPFQRKRFNSWHWSYGVVGILLIGLGIVFGTVERSSQTAYTSTPFPPPASVQYTADTESFETDDEILRQMDAYSFPKNSQRNTSIAGQQHESSNSSDDSLKRFVIDSVSFPRRIVE